MVKINKFNGSEVIVSVKNTKFKATINTIEVDVDGYRTAHAHPSEAYSNTAKIFITTAKGTKTFLYHHIEEDIDSFFEIFTRDGLIYCNILPTQLANSILNEIHGVKKDTNESKKHTKQTIRLTESQFSEVISKTIKKVLRENENNSILNLIFNENEISELYKIKKQIDTVYLNDLEVDPYVNPDENVLIDFIKNSFNNKGVKINDYDLKSVLQLVSNNIRV